ncbi:hypothetical protein ERO13_A07G137600v2 [Gossypium hirsutum]|uniref:Uncharacterized protein n=1 Tax=Gossypium darwinii TaxID=34276 RepID=A0A5D2FY46_GOSDA|nr:hypothetical protein ERO13_A07G137600v2 [Gossypium hirsutum]TYH10205.1 hypothetical protein ES288_A07G160200v1 [Gossypium darwinii]TYH10207.1 hypothetical protein ES288_A07G160200v1 [Gossypium darwinii]TYH10208.1 hypothetical protein ES288_A07G160200v1 [Gossypium darwinii]
MGSVTVKPSLNTFCFIPKSPKIRCHSPHFSFLKLRPSLVSFPFKSPSDPINSYPKCKIRSFMVNPLLVLVPVLRSIRGLAFSHSQKWASRLHDCITESEEILDQYNGNYLQSGGLGMALLSVTASAKVRISPFVATLAANPTFVSGLFAWFIAQSMKIFLNFFIERKWDFRILFASGGMPSSHSALCTALTTSVAICHGIADSLFPVCLGFSLIVMYDAIGVRRHAGMQAAVLEAGLLRGLT